MSTRKQKQQQYEQKYGDIPVDYAQRLEWMVDKYKLSPSKMDEILDKRQAMLKNLFYYDYNVIQLLEEPEGASRPRVRLLRSNIIDGIFSKSSKNGDLQKANEEFYDIIEKIDKVCS